MTTLLRGNTSGHFGEVCGSCGRVNSDGVPPADGTRITFRDGPMNTMLSSSPQLAPRTAPADASHSLMGAPPVTDTFCNPPPPTNPTHCPFGEKNGAIAPSVPGSAVSWSSANSLV